MGTAMDWPLGLMGRNPVPREWAEATLPAHQVPFTPAPSCLDPAAPEPSGRAGVCPSSSCSRDCGLPGLSSLPEKGDSHLAAPGKPEALKIWVNYFATGCGLIPNSVHWLKVGRPPAPTISLPAILIMTATWSHSAPGRRGAGGAFKQQIQSPMS